MVRTRDSVGVKAAGAKASRKIAPSPSTHPKVSSSSDKNKYSGGNPVCPRETPDWQKPITDFFKNSNNESAQLSGSSCAGSSAGTSNDK